ncbi:hypothetical protein M3J09_008546 [Ascochyta lentis]
MVNPSSKPHTVNPTTAHTHTIIFLHGRGSNALEFHNEIFESQTSTSLFLPQLLPGIKWVFPCAPLQHAYLEDEELHQWFDMSSIQNAQESPEVQRPGLWSSARRLMGVIEDEAEIVGMRKIILAGISQGCATAVFTLLATGVRVGGFFGLCGWLPLADEMQSVEAREGEEGEMPVLLQHCRDDWVVPVENGEFLRDGLEELGMSVKWKCFEKGGHWLNEPEGVDEIVAFVKSIMENK